MIELTFIFVASFMLLWILFINVMTWKHKQHEMNKYLVAFLWPIAVFTYILDVVFNWTFACIVFMEWPKEPTLSERMRRLLITDEKWRFGLSYFICRYMIEPWDYNHCGLEKRR